MTANRQILVGVFVIGGFFLFALGLFWIGDRRLLFSESLELETQFANLSGLKVGSKVMVSGMDAGEVLAIRVPPRPTEEFRVRFRVLKQFQPMLRADSSASIQIEGLVGSKVLQIDTGSEQASPVTTGALLPGREPLEISAVIQQGVDMIGKVNAAVDEVEKRTLSTIDTFADVGVRAQKVVVEVGDDVGELVANGKAIASEVNGLVDGVKQGRGIVGKMFTDDKLYERVRNTVSQAETTATNARQTSEEVKKLVADLQSRKLGETLQKTATNVEQATGQFKTVLAALKPATGGSQRGLLDDMRATLANANEATSDLAENMEALKRNWFFRGYFNKRGFFDLDAVSIEDYRQGKIAPERARERTWIHAQDLFTTGSEGEPLLTDAGRQRLDEAMVPYLKYAPNTLLVVEGYAGQGSEQEQFLLSRDRAREVRRYLVERFDLKTNFVGAVPLGAVASSAPSGELWEGVALVGFPEKQK